MDFLATLRAITYRYHIISIIAIRFCPSCGSDNMHGCLQLPYITVSNWHLQITFGLPHQEEFPHILADYAYWDFIIINFS